MQYNLPIELMIYSDEGLSSIYVRLHQGFYCCSRKNGCLAPVKPFALTLNNLALVSIHLYLEMREIWRRVTSGSLLGQH